MSFDLYFYKKQGRELSGDEIGDYLTKNLTPVDENGFQWVFENEDTGVYFIFERTEAEDDPEVIELYESFADFDNTRFAFNLNFIRPNFFGHEAFPFVERFMTDLDLYALNPQSKTDADNPRKETAEDYYSDWSRANLAASAENFDEFQLVYCPAERTDEIWKYNLNRNRFQEKLGDDYFVPSLILAKRASTGDVIALSTWTQHIPNVFPLADYIAIIRQRKKLFRTVDETGIISRDTLMREFGKYLDDFEFDGCKIIHPDNAAKVGDIFNKLKFDHELKGFTEPLDLGSLTNAAPNR